MFLDEGATSIEEETASPTSFNAFNEPSDSQQPYRSHGHRKSCLRLCALEGRIGQIYTSGLASVTLTPPVLSLLRSTTDTPYFRLMQELLKEFNANRFWLNHYEFVDFTVFEYGQRTQYLQWRVFSVLITVLLTAHAFFPGAQSLPAATPYSRFIYMHFWLSTLIILHSVLELAVLVWTYYRTPSPVLVRIHYTPWHFKLIWLMYNILYPNILSCNVMYYAVIKDIEVHLGESRLFIALLASFAGIHVSVTAIPSRVAHILQPLLFNGLHIAFTLLYQLTGFTNHLGQNFVYLEIDWVNSRSSAIGCSLVWLLITSCCHILMVCCCWYRRLVYRSKRTKNAKPIYGFSPEEYYPFNESSEQIPQFELSSLDEKVPGIEEITGTVADDMQPNAPKHYSPHMSYKLMPVPRSMTNRKILEHCPVMTSPDGLTTAMIGRCKKAFKTRRSKILCKDFDELSGPWKASNSGNCAKGGTRCPPARLKCGPYHTKMRPLGLTPAVIGRRRKGDRNARRKTPRAARESLGKGNSRTVVKRRAGDLLHSLQDTGQSQLPSTSDALGEHISLARTHAAASKKDPENCLSDQDADCLSENATSQWETSVVHECTGRLHTGFSTAE